LENNPGPGGEGEVIAVMKRKRDIMDYDLIQMIAVTGLVFMMISLNSSITELEPVGCWIGGVVKSGHEADRLA